MMEYQSWDFCKSVKCNAMLYPKKMRKGLICNTCKAYQMHQHLQEQGYSIESTLREENDLQRVSIQSLSRQPGASLLAELAKYKRAYEEICHQFNFGDEADYNAMHDCWLDWAELDHIPDTTKMIKEGQDES